MEEFNKISDDLTQFVDENKQHFSSVSICGFINCITRLKVLYLELHEKNSKLIENKLQVLEKTLSDNNKKQSSLLNDMNKTLLLIKNSVCKKSINRKS